jgi:Holliday junction resolvase
VSLFFLKEDNSRKGAKTQRKLKALLAEQGFEICT